MQNRRHFLQTGFSLAAAGLAGAAALAGARRTLAEEASPETTTVRLLYWKDSTTCHAPLDILDDLLRDEGFADVRLVAGADTEGSERLARGDVDFTQDFAASVAISIDAGVPLFMVAGVHPGCFELFARESIRSVVDLKGKTVGVSGTTQGDTDYVMIKIIARSVGLDPDKDINWAAYGEGDPKSLLVDEKIDAFMTFPPWAQEARAVRAGHVILNSAVERPWSQYFCCMAVGNVDFVRGNPIATKRVVRAWQRANDICADKRDSVAQRLVDRGFTPRYDYTRQTLDDVSYSAWREYDAEDAVRFWALRLRELGIIKSSPDKIIAAGTDFSFLKEVRKEYGL